MRVTSIAVRGLFGLFNHEIPLQSAERVTIIHSPNGFGKTAILKMIAGLIQGQTDIFQHTPFDEFSATLEDGTSRIIRRSIVRGPEGKPQIKLEFLEKDTRGNMILVPSPSAPEIPRRVLSEIDHFVPGPYRLSGAGWTDGTQIYTLHEIIRMFPRAAERVPREYLQGVIFEIFRELRVFFVQTNRLSASMPRKTADISPYYIDVDGEHSESPTPRVKYYSDDIVQRIRTALTQYASHSQERDRTFPERLVRFVREGYTKLPEREILAKMTELEEKRRRLISLGLLESEHGLQDLPEEDVRRAQEALTIYVGDIEEKLKVFDDLARRIGTLIDILNSRFKYKQLTISRSQGFRVLGPSEQTIDIEDLSSGEQHELVVLYELLFRCPNNGLILIDEPEISLHVAWQARFLPDLISILQPSDAYAIVATHSPVVIGKRLDLTVELAGPEIPSEKLEHAGAR